MSDTQSQASQDSHTQFQVLASVLNIENLPPPAVSLLRVLSMLHSDAIHENILTYGSSKVMLEDYPETKSQYSEARQQLITSSLISHNIEHGLLRIHGSIQDVVRQRLALGVFRRVYDAAVVLVSSVWPFMDDTNLNNAARLQQVRRYAPHVASLRTIAEEKGVTTLKAQIQVAALFNEVSWSHILQSWGYNLRDGADYAVLSQRIIEAYDHESDGNLASKLLADSYRFQAITATYMGDSTALPSCRTWISLLVERIEKLQDEGDINMLPIAYNELGMALMRIPDQQEAIKSWEMSCDTIEKSGKKGDLPFPFPWVHRALTSAYSGDPDTALELIIPLLKERETRLGIDDTETIETGFILSFLGNIYRIKNLQDEAFSHHKRGARALKTTTGERSSFATQAFYRLARDHYERKECEDATGLLEQCITFAGDAPWYKAEGARARWKLGHTLLAQGNDESQSRARDLLEDAMRLRHELDPCDHREEPELEDEDWDRLIYYFSR